MVITELNIYSFIKYIINITENFVGEHLYDFDSCLVLAHFKGHAMGGFGGAMKQLSIGFASRAGKANILQVDLQLITMKPGVTKLNN